MTIKTGIASPLFLAIAFSAGLLSSGQVWADDDGWLTFDGTMDGQFVLGPGNALDTFSVRTIGLGGSTLGPLSFAAYVFQDLSEGPPGCGLGSSIGAGGQASLVLADGSLQLERKQGDACFAPPAITVDETYRVIGGTGLYKGARGKIISHFDGEVVEYTLDATFFGFIKFDEDQDEDGDNDSQ
jgi:hypothetical protein